MFGLNKYLVVADGVTCRLYVAARYVKTPITSTRAFAHKYRTTGGAQRVANKMNQQRKLRWRVEPYNDY